MAFREHLARPDRSNDEGVTDAEVPEGWCRENVEDWPLWRFITFYW